MADIIYKKYIIRPESYHFNLYELKTVKKEGEPDKEREYTIGYGYTFGRVLHVIASLETVKKESVTNIRAYISEYKKLKEDLENSLG